MRLTLFLLFGFPLLSFAAGDAAGRWEGSAQIPENELHFVVDLDQENGAWRGSVIVQGMDLKGVPLSDVAVKDAEVSFTINGARGLQAVCKGTVNEQGTLAGDFVMAGNSARFTLKKTGPPQVESPPTSTAIGKEFEGEWKGDYAMFGYSRHVTIKLVSHDKQPATSEFVVVGKRVNNLPVDLIIQEGALLSVEAQTAGIMFEGRLESAGNQIKGEILQGTIASPLTLEKSK